ncbi:acyl-CoA N-acyltransferase [Mycena maculata]|uniref:Acyl-CoA N-acyltransferase n=1 Tax=Mycena maculata TaxID=230809 RepID=A0AAD7J569_9AGAR|nr:acyl-CoA N-acyltransferase [Mycena maculata]
MNETSISDANSRFSIPESGLETPRVKLTPYLPLTHNDEFFAQLSAHPELERYLPMPFTPAIIQDALISDPDSIIFAVIDKTKGEHGKFAGVIGLLHTSWNNRTTEIGPVMCFPEFQRTFVSSNAVGILMKYCLDLPKDGGLGFRRVQWTANPLNAASIKIAERMGMKMEGTMRWTWILPEGIEGKEAGEGRGEGLGRDSVLLAAYWDEWESGGREHVAKIVDRTS